MMILTLSGCFCRVVHRKSVNTRRYAHSNFVTELSA